MTKTIVWIEDDIDIIRPVVRPLERSGYTIIPLRDAKEVFDNVDRLHEAELILLDIFLPHGSVEDELSRFTGVDIFEKMKKIYNVTTPVVALTVVAREEVRKRLRELGIADIIRKPVRPSELKERVEQILGK